MAPYRTADRAAQLATLQDALIRARWWQRRWLFAMTTARRLPDPAAQRARTARIRRHIAEAGRRVRVLQAQIAALQRQVP